MTAPDNSQNLLQPPQPGMHTDVTQMYKFSYELWVRSGGLTSGTPNLSEMKTSVTELNSLVGINHENSVQEHLDLKANSEDLGTIVTQDADNVTITGGSITDVSITDGSISGADILIPVSSQTIPIGGKLVFDTTSVGNVGAGEDTLITYAMAADTLDQDGSFLDISTWGTFAANANNKRIKLKLGTTTLLDTTAVAANSGSWSLSAKIIRTGSATQKVIASIISDNALVLDSATFTSGTEDLTTDLNLFCTGEATSNDDIIQEGLIINWYK